MWAWGNLTSITPPVRPEHSFSYSVRNEQKSYSAPEAGSAESSTSYDYNDDRQLTSVTRPGGETVGLSYDAGGRLSKLTYPEGETKHSYDSQSGNLSSTSTEGGMLSYTYDGFLPTSETLSGEVSGKVSLKYDNNFRVISLGVNTETPIGYSYDNDDLITGAGSLSVGRDPKNGLITGTRLNNLTDTQTYNAFGELAGYKATYQSGYYNNTLEEWFATSYERDNAGRITKKTETVGDITSTYTYRYNAADRLAEVKKDGQTVGSYTYDDNGNRLSATSATGGTVEADYDDQDRLLEYGDTSYSYAPSGELSSKTEGGQSTSYDYDTLGILRSVSLPDGRKVQYMVDGRNRRTGKKVDGRLVQGFLYAGQRAPIAELDGAGRVISRFVYATKSNVPDYMIRNGVTYRIISDDLGSPRLVVNAQSGEIVQRMDFDEFGNVIMDTNPGFQPFGFAGGLFDRDTSLVRFGARDYDPETGRWTAKDPIGFAGGDTNLYGYVLSDPVNFNDPSGQVLGLHDWFGINTGEEYGDSASYYWAAQSIQPDNTWYENVGYWSGGLMSSLWTSCTSNDTFWTLATAGVGSSGAEGARAAGYSVKLQRYPNARGVGLNFYSKNSTHATKLSRRAIDWHQFKNPRKTGPLVNRPHIDRKYVPGKRNLRHWPWQ